MSWDDFRVLREVMNSGGLAEAAARLDLSHATVRRYIKRLEYRLGMPLFTHVRMGVAPTPAAQALSPGLERLDALAGLFRRLAASPPDALYGPVRVVADPFIARDILSPAWAAVAERYAGLLLELDVVEPVDPKCVAAGRADLAVTLVSEPRDGLEFAPAGVLKWGVFVHQSVVDEFAEPVTAEDLNRVGLVMPRDAAAFEIQLRALGLQTAEALVTLRSDETTTRLAAIRAGGGVGFAPLLPGAAAPPAWRVLPQVELSTPVFIGMRKDARDIRRIAFFSDMIRDALISALTI